MSSPDRLQVYISCASGSIGIMGTFYDLIAAVIVFVFKHKHKEHNQENCGAYDSTHVKD